MSEKTKRKGFTVSIAVKLTAFIVLMTLVIAVVSVLIGRDIYYNDITTLYNNMAKNIAETEAGAFTPEELKEWGDVALRYSRGQATDEELAAVTGSARYKQMFSLTENLCDNMRFNDIYIAILDIDVIDKYTPELKAAKQWNPIVYIMDAYSVVEERFPMGAASGLSLDYKDTIREHWVKAEQLSFDKPAITYFTGKYVLTGMSIVTDNGESVAVIGVEVALPTLEQDLKDFTIQIMFIDMIVLLVIIAIAVILLLVLIVRPIRTVAAEAERFVSDNANISEKLGKIKTHDEIQGLSQSLLSLEHGVRDYISDITRINAEKERVSAELNVAAKMQADMLPKKFPERDDIEIFATMAPAKEMGGDFYDFFMIDDDHIALVIADVSGKGVPAAMFMIVTRTLMKLRTMRTGYPSKMLHDVNNTLCVDNPSGLFVTAWLGILTLSTGELISANAGHEYPAIMHENGSYEFLAGENMPPLAADEDLEYVDETITLRKGDRLFLYTDGVPEAKSADGSRFGENRMLEILNREKSCTPEELLKTMKREIDGFTGESDPFDDVTMMSVVWHGK